MELTSLKNVPSTIRMILSLILLAYLPANTLARDSLNNEFSTLTRKSENPQSLRRSHRAALLREPNLLRSPSISPTKEPKCDHVITSTVNGSQSGQVEAPELHNPHGYGISCIYTIKGQKGQRVELSLRRFNLRGTPPECNHEYLDVYTEIKDPDNYDLLDAAFGGRFCGKIGPRLRISLHETIILVFYTDNTTTTAEQFMATYNFFNESKYEVGIESADQCGHLIKSSQLKNGQFMTPTYPGVYPQNYTCFFKFVGQPGQRIRIEFRDFDLFYGGPHCPLDMIMIYDGPDRFSGLIGTYCGQQRNLVIFSSNHTMLLVFTTLDRKINTQNRGFQGIFNFSESYVTLDFINKKESEHIRGTECDQRVLSKKESNGTVFSPNYPFPYFSNIVCRYFIYGMETSQDLEKVRLEFFDRFDIPMVPMGRKNCSDGYLRIYLRGQEVEYAYDKPDYEVCGKTLPDSVVANGPRLFLVFSSGSQVGVGFKANYKFETEYLVPGTAAPDGKCTFSYYSSSRQSGSFNSPRHPANYPSNLTCEYTFYCNPNEQVKLVFHNFQINSSNKNTTYGKRCQKDWVEVYNIYKPVGDKGMERERLMGIYCQTQTPGPIISERDAVGLRVMLHTDHKDVRSGFSARYFFSKKKPLFTDCGGNITGQKFGIITSPYWPEKYNDPEVPRPSYSCDWYIQVNPLNKVLLWFQEFAVEGSYEDRGCPAAVVRVWSDLDSVPNERCGDSLKGILSYTSKKSVLRVSFFTANRSVGARGFKAIWTEIEDSPDCNQFLCRYNNYCISKRLVCNRINNCGPGDNSDEEHCVKATEVNVLMLVGVGLGISSVFLIVVCFWCRRKKIKRREGGPLPPGVYERGARLASVDSFNALKPR